MTTAPKALALFDSLPPAGQVSVIVDLFHGSPSFDVAAQTPEYLRAAVASWVDSGAMSPDTLALSCAKVVAAIFTPAPVAPMPAPMPAAPIAPAAPVAVVIPVFAPAEQPAPGADVPAASYTGKPATSPDKPAAATIAAAPVALRDGVARRVLARELFTDLPQSIIAAIPADLYVMHYAHPDAPAIDPLYAFDPINLPAMLGGLACAPSERVWCYGPRASGKSVGAAQIAARLGRPCFRVSFNRATEAADILGDIGLVNGATQWCDGPVTQALRTPGAVCILDEITYCPTAHLAALNPLLERGALSLRLPKTGEILTAAPDVAFIVCDNTNGHGASSEYVGRSQISADLLDRFGLFLQFDYLPADTERRVLRAMVKGYCGIKPTADLARAVCKVMAIARAKADAGELEGAPSLRRAAAFCTALVQGMEPAKAYTLTCVNPAPLDSAEALRQIFAASWDHGKPAAPAPDANNPFAAAPEFNHPV